MRRTDAPHPHLHEAGRIALLLALAGAVLAWQVARTEILFADGLRYINQAREIERGGGPSAVRQAVDHPLYPLAILAAWRVLGAADDAEGWQLAAQVAAATAGVLLVVPLYLVARRLVGRNGAWLGVALTYLSPIPTRVFSDTLSESTFLLFWAWGLWAALRYQRAGSVRWLVAALLFGALSYLVRPEGLLLPLALCATLAVAPLTAATRLPATRWWGGVALLGLGAAALVGPFVAFKGGIATKPAVARILGLAPPSPRDAVERERPLDPDQSALRTGLLAARAAGQAVGHAVSIPLLPLAAIGLAARARRTGRSDARAWVFLGVVVLGSSLALMRLHATGGYCTPRHALLVALPLLACSGGGLRVLTAASLRGRRGGRLRRLAAAVGLVFAVGLGAWNAEALAAPLNAGKGSYRDAGRWLAAHTGGSERVVDVTGWSLFYGGRPGYTFATLAEAEHDPTLAWVVVREAHLRGPWGYCERLRNLVRRGRLVARFPDGRRGRTTQVFLYRLGDAPLASGAGLDRR